MKEIKKQVTETVTREETHYICDISGCNFSATWDATMKQHMAKHLEKKTVIINHTKFIWFDSEHDADMWLDGQIDMQFHRNNVCAPGWYGAYCSDEPGYGGDTVYGVSLVGASYIENKWQLRRDELNEELDDIKRGLIEIEGLQK